MGHLLKDFFPSMTAVANSTNHMLRPSPEHSRVIVIELTNWRVSIGRPYKSLLHEYLYQCKTGIIRIQSGFIYQCKLSYLQYIRGAVDETILGAFLIHWIVITRVLYSLVSCDGRRDYSSTWPNQLTKVLYLNKLSFSALSA